MDEGTDRLVAELRRLTDQIAEYVALKKQEREEKRTGARLPPVDYRPSPLLAGRWPQRDGNTYSPVQYGDAETRDIRPPNER